MATTTPEAIRDRFITVIETLTPSRDSGTRFRAYRNEGGADFIAWAEAHPAGAQRRVQVRTSLASEAPLVSNTDVEEHRVTITVLVAYAQNARMGTGQALDRDDAMDADQFQIDYAVGMCGAANFSPPYADATWVDGSPASRIVGAACDFIQLEYTMTYWRAR